MHVSEALRVTKQYFIRLMRDLIVVIVGSKERGKERFRRPLLLTQCTWKIGSADLSSLGLHPSKPITVFGRPGTACESSALSFHHIYKIVFNLVLLFSRGQLENKTILLIFTMLSSLSDFHLTPSPAQVWASLSSLHYILSSLLTILWLHLLHSWHERLLFRHPPTSPFSLLLCICSLFCT